MKVKLVLYFHHVLKFFYLNLSFFNFCRIRPQISRDILDLCHVCTTTVPNEPQIWIGSDKSYTFDRVFDMPTHQDKIFDSCVKDLVDG